MERRRRKEMRRKKSRRKNKKTKITVGIQRERNRKTIGKYGGKEGLGALCRRQINIWSAASAHYEREDRPPRSTSTPNNHKVRICPHLIHSQSRLQIAFETFLIHRRN